MKKATSPKRSSNVRRQRDPQPWKYCLLTLVCGLLLVAGFFWAARSHFASMDYGMKNAELRKEIEELQSENRRLQLAREIALSPGEIKKAAKKLGLTAMTAENIEIVGAKTKPLEKKPEASNAAETPAQKAGESDKKTATEDKGNVKEKEKAGRSEIRKSVEKKPEENTGGRKTRPQIAKK
jgi:hypothetical protein